MSQADARHAKPTRRLRLAAVLVVLAALVVMLAIGAYLARRAIARQATSGWLEARGVESQVEFQRLTPNGLVAKVRAGPAADPDLIVERVEVTYDMFQFRRGRWMGPQVSSVRLVRPVVKARLRGRTLSFGALDPIVDEFRRRPPKPDAAKPHIRIEEGQVRLLADFGQARLSGDGEVKDGKLTALSASLAPASLAGQGFAAEIAGGALDLTTAGDRTRFRAEVRLAEGRLRDTALRSASMQLAGDAPYPDLERRKQDGQVRLAARLQAGEFRHGAARLERVNADANFAGQSTGWLERLQLAGTGGMNLRAANAGAAGAQARTVRLDLRAPSLSWSRTGGQADLRLGGSAGFIKAADLELRQVSGAFSGGAAQDATGLRGGLSGRAAAAGGRFTGLGAAGADDGPQTAAMKRAVETFQVRLPQVRMTVDPDGASLRLLRPAEALSRSGARLTIAERGAAYDHGRGGLAATLEGGGLPSLAVDAARFRLTGDGLRAQAVQVRGEGDFDLFRGFRAALAGDLAADARGLRFVTHNCTPVTVERLDLGENQVTAVRGRLCGGPAPLLTIAQGGWALRAGYAGLRADAGFLEAGLRDAAGTLQVKGGERMTLDATVRSAELEDLAAERRFNPLRGKGEAHMAGDQWRGRFDIADRNGARLGQAELRHDGRRETGGLTFDTGALALAPGGVQPAELSPLAEMIASPATGEVRFQGQVGWSQGGTTSSGILQVPRLDFRSPAGPVTGLTGRIELASLTPLVTRGPQRLTAEQIGFMAPLNRPQVTFEVKDEILRLAEAEAEVSQGRVRVEPLAIPMKPDASWEGVLVVEGVQLSDLVEASPLADRLDLQAQVSGRLPFMVTPGGVKFVQGRLASIAPGRISIQREALAQVVADETQAVVETPNAAETVGAGQNVIVDLAYQAMEDLAFQSLAAEVNSLPNGRLGVLLQIEGEHAPPKPQRARLSIIDLLRRKFLDKPLPLPSGTKVNLTLDTSLNLDQLLADYAAYQTRGSASVQPPPAKTE